MKINTSELSDIALDWAVAVAEGYGEFDPDGMVFQSRNGKRDHLTLSKYSPSADQHQGGLIIDREMISADTWQRCSTTGNIWAASFSYPRAHPTDPKKSPSYHRHRGPTRLVAAMRCYVALKLGDELEIPQELYARLNLAA